MVRMRSGRNPRSWKASPSTSLKARALGSNRLPRRAGPASAIDAGRPAAMASNGAGSGRIRASIPAGPALYTGASLGGGHDQGADHPVRLMTGQVADVQVRARRVEGDRRLAARSGRDRDLRRARAVDRLGAGAVALV